MERGGMGKKKRNKREGKKEMKMKRKDRGALSHLLVSNLTAGLQSDSTERGCHYTSRVHMLQRLSISGGAGRQKVGPRFCNSYRR